MAKIVITDTVKGTTTTMQVARIIEWNAQNGAREALVQMNAADTMDQFVGLFFSTTDRVELHP
jgi:hypothetical protein